MTLNICATASECVGQECGGGDWRSLGSIRHRFTDRTTDKCTLQLECASLIERRILCTNHKVRIITVQQFL